MGLQMSLPLWRSRPATGLPARAVAAAATAPALNPGWYQRDAAIMGTAIHVELWAERRHEAEAAMTAVMDEMHRIDHRYSPHRPDSELSRLNRSAARTPFAVSAEMFYLLATAQSFSELSDGAFDLSFAAVGRLYDYRRGVAPDARTLAAARACVNWRGIELDRNRRSVRFAREGMCIDLGGFAKGHAVDCAANRLKALGIRHAYVSAGGDSRVIGSKGGRPWSVAIRHPRRADEVVAVLPLEDVAVSTSGDYERYFERDGVRHHHLIDPATGCSPSGVHSVSIVAEDGLTSEALSKTVFVLGVERGLAIVDKMPGADAVVVDAQGRLHFTSGLQAH
jgi:thiamine biosynthesis lipoprotein